MSDATTATANTSPTASNNEDTTTKDKGKAPVLGGVLEDESIYRAREAAEFEALVDSSLKNDLGCSTTGFYELVAIVTHKGAAADSGHYIGFVKKSVFYEAKAKAATSPAHKLAPNLYTTVEEYVTAHTSNSPGDVGHVAALSDLANSTRSSAATEPLVSGPSTSSTLLAFDSEEDEDWYKFDDDKVTEFPKEKLSTLEGGGEDSSAYVLIYRSKVL